MADVELVIRIPEELYQMCRSCLGDADCIESVIANGTPLQKGHGDLIDISNLKYIFDLTREDSIYSGKDIERAIKSMKTIIKADKESEEV